MPRLAVEARVFEEPVRVLFVDDEMLVLQALRCTLRDLPYDLTFVSDPYDALRQAQTLPFDVVVSDHAMPGMTGIELLSALQAERDDTVRLMMTGHGDRTLALRAINEGHVDRLIDKPWDDQALRAALHDAAELALRRRRTEQERRAALTGRGSVRLRVVGA